MKIILSPAKQMNTKNAFHKKWDLNKYSKQVVDALVTLNDNEIKKYLKINDSILTQVKEYHKDFRDNVTYQALDLYDGLAFRYLKNDDLSDEAKAYLDEHLLILSALYGPIKPNEYIKPYRLDLLSTVKINGSNLRNFWKGYYASFLKENEMVLNLASDEFSSMFEKDRYHWIDFDFYEIKDGKEKKHSTISKKARGLMTRYLAENKVKSLDDILEFNLDGYRFSEEDSKGNLLVFIKDLD